ncbi:hypothetical protein EIP91_010905 [Steccherinum ochraceum]|uniref:DUF6533 domain-containing protein n=1 Tax=Steccherinum ochraceum TaxID=92696 RepID=A0A4R0RLF9_9APHY|nr:hypothetical protein EIP91_010905 [Steccherinum ochraceum]
MTTLEDAARELTNSRYLNLVAFAILYYDYGLTISEEVARYWFTGGFTWMAFLFFAVRYLSVFGHLPVIFHVFSSYDGQGPLCVDSNNLFEQRLTHSQVIVGILLIVRTYALYNRNRWVLGVTVGIAISGAVVACWAVLTPHGPPPPTVSDAACNVNLSDLQGIYFAIAWSGMLFFDCLIFGLTVARSIVLSRTARRTLFDIMLRDGAIYFACMAGANLWNIITFIVLQPSLKGVPTIFTNVISTTLISRLMLNIRDPRILQQSRTFTTTTDNSAGPLTRDLPFYSTLYPDVGDMSMPVTPNPESPANLNSYELHPLNDRGDHG